MSGLAEGENVAGLSAVLKVQCKKQGVERIMYESEEMQINDP